MEITVNQRVLMLKEHLKLTDIDFCNHTRISTGTLHRIKNNSEVSAKVINAICDAFGVSREWLINGIGEMEINMKQSTPETSNPWKDEAYNNLKEENSFLKTQIQMMREMMRVLNPQANFNLAFGIAGQNVVSKFIGTEPLMLVKSVSKAA